MKKVRRILVTVPLLFVMTAAASAGQDDMPTPSSTPPTSSTSVETSTSDSTDTTVSDDAAATLTELVLIVSQSLPSPF
ncbi:MAG: hypothetical protein DMF65_04470 [Acidobacteria bacterium]|nr:MAG: hypothetical protein DMF65_04470 [Acidobacteriota bacterium]